jgi:agmatine deiminase
MLFPHRPDTWRESAGPAQAAFARVAAQISRFEPVTVGVSAAVISRARPLMPPPIRLIELETDDAWMRDVGPTFVVNAAREVRGVDWRFNAWGGTAGGLYSQWDRDDAAAVAVCDAAGIPYYRAEFVMEGGAIHVDGQGTALVTRQCLLNPNRGSHLTESLVERRLRDYLGVRRVIWLDEGILFDETDGHIDNMACFVAPGHVVLAWCDDPRDAQYRISRSAYEVLSDATDANGRRFMVSRLPLPEPMTMTVQEASGIVPVEGTRPRRAGDRMAASYVNFYLANGAVIVPQFGDVNDAAAVRIIAGLFPDRKVVPVAGREILLGGGCIHCITQQQPSGRVSG